VDRASGEFRRGSLGVHGARRVRGSLSRNRLALWAVYMEWNVMSAFQSTRRLILRMWLPRLPHRRHQAPDLRSAPYG